MELKVFKNDLTKVGHTKYANENGNLNLICDGVVANISEILLRNILQCFGEEYKILEVYDDLDIDGIEFITNLPYEKFDKLHTDSSK